MAPKNYLHRLKVAVTVAFIFSITILPSKSVGSVSSGYSSETSEQRKMVLGSKPPGCVNKCFNCRPCMATLVIPSHQRKDVGASSRGEDDSYYLLSWKCRCGNKLYQP
ncbi:EPIDERMAL PATTERNING FACTOR-like protein 8 [Fagus crenata]|uniref:Epidermal patterning factor-like protein n=1 Tax=Fagus sylvatica TaxID=28930 RepID=A0A2N9J8K1_FAGSY